MELLPVLRFVRNRAGQDLVDYALLAGGLTLLAAAFLPSLCAVIATVFNEITAALLGRTSGART
jgi:Flp pilus assembly pilin Flp